MSYKDEWLVIEANDDIDEMEHREPSEEFLFYRAVANGDVDAVRKNCEQGRFMDTEGVGVLSRDPITNLKYHFVVTTAMVTRMCRQHGTGIPAERFLYPEAGRYPYRRRDQAPARRDGDGLHREDAPLPPQQHQLQAHQCLQGIHLRPYQGADHH